MLLNEVTEIKIDPRIKRTRALIEMAFGSLLTEKGFSAITVQDITERAEINRATFYAHYTDKFALLESTIQKVFRQELESRTLHACHYNKDNLCALIVTVCEFIEQGNGRCKSTDSQFELLLEQQVRKQIQELIELWLGVTQDAGNPKIAAIAASWTIYGLALHHFQDKSRGKPTAEQFARMVMPLVQANLDSALQPVSNPA